MIFILVFYGLLIFLFQPIFSLLFLFLFPVLNYFSQNKIKESIFSLIPLSFLTDLIFIKPFGFFLALTSFCLFFISLIGKIISFKFFYQKIIFLFIFNFLFLFLFFYFSNFNLSSWVIFLKVFLINFSFQLCYFFVKNILGR